MNNANSSCQVTNISTLAGREDLSREKDLHLGRLNRISGKLILTVVHVTNYSCDHDKLLMRTALVFYEISIGKGRCP